MVMVLLSYFPRYRTWRTDVRLYICTNGWMYRRSRDDQNFLDQWANKFSKVWGSTRTPSVCKSSATNVFTLNSKAICEEISFPSFLRKMLMSAFLLRVKASYLKKNMWLPQFFFVDSNSTCKDLLFPHGPSLVQKPLY